MSVSTESSNDTELPANESNEPLWRNKEVLYRLYWIEGLTQEEIGNELGCRRMTVVKWMDRLGINSRHDVQVCHTIEEREGVLGYEAWRYDNTTVQVHRLTAVAEFGFEAVVAADAVHHKSSFKFDNRRENFELVSHAEHGRLHSNESEFVTNELGYPELVVE